MIDNAAIIMAKGVEIAAEKLAGVNDNMNASHFHDFAEIYYLLEGGRQYVIDGSLYPIEARTLVLIPPQVLHYSYGLKDVPFNRIVVYFREEGTGPALFKRACEAGGVMRLEGEDAAFIETQLAGLIAEEEHPDSDSQAMRRALLTLLLTRLLRLKLNRQEPVNSDRIRKVIRYLNDHYTEEISLDALAAHFYISKYHLCREFRKYTHNSIIEYLNFVRVIHAQRLFMETDKNVSEVAAAVGFASLTHFERIFTKMTGQKPLASRREIARAVEEKKTHRKEA